MEKFDKISVADSSPLIALASLENLGLLEKFYSSIAIPEEVFYEISVKDKPFADYLESWGENKIVRVKNIKAVSILSEIIDKGEAEAIILSEEIQTDVLLIDDLKGRRISLSRNLQTIGTLGILLKEKFVNKDFQLKDQMDELMKNGFRLNDEIYQIVMETVKDKQLK